jgi:basic amino acid/polyamine antiporter, APA family
VIGSGGQPELARRLTTGDAVVSGLGSMIGAGGVRGTRPAAQAAGAGVLAPGVVVGLLRRGTGSAGPG